MYQNNDRCSCNWDENWVNDRREQRHVHEITGSTAVFNERNEECHNHRFATVSGESIRYGNSHVHEIKFRTDFADGHFHEFRGTSGPAIEVGNGKHVHFASACTEEEDGHRHRFQVASLIESPLDFECEA
ncbi:YmaF family protein [Anaerotignum sp.]|nr:YmaF family protein [Anaerotignum sp.]MBQ7757871.1 YmaF family protein [Anaerotignum sp.]